MLQLFLRKFSSASRCSSTDRACCLLPLFVYSTLAILFARFCILFSTPTPAQNPAPIVEVVPPTPEQPQFSPPAPVPVAPAAAPIIAPAPAAPSGASTTAAFGVSPQECEKRKRDYTVRPITAQGRRAD